MRVFEEYQKMIFLAEILMNKLEYEVSEMKPDDERLGNIIEKAYNTRLKMDSASQKWGNPDEMMEQITRLDNVIKKLEELQNKHVNDL